MLLMKCSYLNFRTIFHIMRSIFSINGQKEIIKSIHLSHIRHFIYVSLAKFVLLKIIIYQQTIHSSGYLKTVLSKFQRHHKYMLREYFV